MVEYGNHENVKIIEVFDDGKFYEVYIWGIIPEGTQGAGNPTKSKQFCAWYKLFKLKETPNREILSKKNKFKLHYSQQCISSLLCKVYHFGVDFDADYQREIVWTMEDKLSLIDSIMESRDIGKFLFMELPVKVGKPHNQIVDGKQRLTTICEFYEDKFKWRGKYYSELSRTDRSHFENRAVSIAEIDTMPRRNILELFLFVNDTGKQISKEHLDKVKNMLNESIKK
jgi:hypothetical protein